MHLITIVVVDEGKRIMEVPVRQDTYVLGRHDSCDIMLEDKTISRKHARLEIKDEEAFVEDLGSRNGTYVNGQKVARRQVTSKDTIVIGKFTVTVEGLAASTGKPAPPSRVEQRGEATILTSLDASKIGSGRDIKEGEVDPGAATERLSTLYELGQKLCGRLGTAEIAGTFLDMLLRVFEKADRAVVLVEDRMSRELIPIAALDRKGEPGEIRLSTTVVNSVLREKCAVLCSDTTADERFAESRSLQDLRIKSIMCVPLLAADTVIGMVEVSSGKGGITFSEDDLRLLTGLASEVSIALENARLYDQVEQSKRLAAIGQTVSGVAHCVKNVLNGIDGGLFIAQKALESNNSEKLEKGWDMLNRNAGFLKTLVLDMLDYSKQREPEYEEVDLAAYMEDLRSFVADRAATMKVDLNFNTDESLKTVKLDVRQSKRAFLNIIGNAIEATPEGGRVEVSAERKSAEEFDLVIADTGTGIPEDKIDTIFEPFFSTKGSKGTGLGLPVTKKIIEEHRGTIEIESEEGKGTTFRITIPIGK
jgi:signal transduction histidine kinase/pSer/pThr/pTyr-binding forkhead associated (FHA) protein